MPALLVHGLGRSPASMLSLKLSLRKAGVDAELFGYAALASSVTAIVERLSGRLEAMERVNAPFVVAGHSLGGLLLRLAIDRVRPAHLCSVVMAGTPNRPPRLARLAVKVPPFRWLTGEAGLRLADSEWYETLPPPTFPYTIIAGTRGLYGRWSPFGQEPNDGIVAVSETLIEVRDPLIKVPATHTFLMNHPRVREAILAAGAVLQ